MCVIYHHRILPPALSKSNRIKQSPLPLNSSENRMTHGGQKSTNLLKLAENQKQNLVTALNYLLAEPSNHNQQWPYQGEVMLLEFFLVSSILEPVKNTKLTYSFD